MAKLGHLPKRGEHILIDGLMFTILHADMRGIKLLECVDKRTSENSQS